MQNALKNGLSTPAEIRRGMVLDLDLSGPVGVAKQGGTITGTPSFTTANGQGVVLNGSSEYVTYAIQGNEFNNAELSFVLEFTPEFEATDVSGNCFLDSGAANDYLISQDGTAGIRIDMGNTTIGSIPSATLALYWLTNQRNVLVITTTTGNTNAWLNGNQVMTADATAWTPTSTTSMYIGSIAGATWWVDGTIHSFKIFHSLLTADEATAYYNSSMYTYRNSAVIDLNMRAEDHDPSNLGDDVIVDGDMEAAGTAAYTAANNAILSKQSGTRTGGSGSQVLRVAKDDVNNPYAKQTVITIGKVYRVRGWAHGDGGVNNPTIWDGAGGAEWTGTTSTTWQSFDFIYTATNNNIRLYGAGAAGYSEYDDITVEEVRPRTLDRSGNGNHALLGSALTTTQPTKGSKHGYEFDGTSDYTIGMIPSGTMNSNEISFVIEFTPDFNWNEDAPRYFFDTTVTDRYYVRTSDNADGNILRIHMGNSTIEDIASATYSPYWLQNQRNTFVISSDSVNNLTNAWLNGVQILIDDTNAWTAANPTEVYIGATSIPSLYFDGTIHSFQVYPFAINPTQAEAIKIQKAREGNNV